MKLSAAYPPGFVERTEHKTLLFMETGEKGPGLIPVTGTAIKHSIVLVNEKNNYLCALMKKGLVLFVAAVCMGLVFPGCSEYQKVLKSDDINLKYDKALEYYEEEEYYKAYPLFEDLIAIYRGTDKAERLYYLYAYTDYYLQDYILAAHRFSKFVKTFPTSQHVKECQFMIGYCHYLNSPRYSLDQTNTYKAIDELQLYTNLYPKSDLVDSCNTLIEGLIGKLAKKDFEISYHYFYTESYNAAIVSFKNFLDGFPDSELREEAEFTILRSHYQLALNSVTSKKMERIEETIAAYVNFVDSFPNSKFIRKAESMYETMLEEKKTLNEENT